MTHFVVALACEARPLLERYRMRAQGAESGFRVYRSNDHDLVVSGVGKIAAAAATAYLAARSQRSDPWINFGIAGHPSRPVGEVLMAGKIIDSSSGSCWYPPRHFEAPPASVTLITVDTVETAYSEEAAYDMEGAGFWPTARRFREAELVQCVKVVSDSPSEPAERLRASQIEALIESGLRELEQLRLALDELCAGMPARVEIDFAPFHSHHRLSATQRRRLTRLVERRSALHGEPFSEATTRVLEVFAEAPGREGATRALDRVQVSLDEHPVRLARGLGSDPDPG